MIESFYEIQFEFGSKCDKKQLKELQKIIPSARFYNRDHYSFGGEGESFKKYCMEGQKEFEYDPTFVNLKTLAKVDLGTLRCTLKWRAYSVKEVPPM